MIRAWIHSIAAVLRRLRDSTCGGVALIGALSLTTMVGMGAFAVEATRGYAADTANQRIADMAALAGALAYNVNSNTTQMTATAKAVVVAQGLPATAADVQLVTDAATSKQLVQVTVTTAVPLALGRVFTSALSYDVSAVGSATTTTTATVSPPCIVALNGAPTYAISMDGGTILSAAGCAVNSAAGVTVSGGAKITAKQVNAGKSVSITGGASITTSPTATNVVQNKANAASDWMKDDTALKAILCQVNKLGSTTDPDYGDGNTLCVNPLVLPGSTTGAENWDLGYSPAANVASFRTSNNTYVIPAVASRTIGALNIAGGMTVTFAGPSNLTIGAISMGGTALHFGSGNVSIASISVNGGAAVDFDVGVGNTITIGSSGATAINLGGGSTFCFTLGCVAPTAAAGTFSIGGDIVTAGGSQMVFPKAALHVINGTLNLSGGAIFGSGKYVIRNNFTNGTGGALTGTDVTFALGGTFTLAGGTSLDLAAPGASSSYGIPGILIATKSSSATSIGGGSGNKYAGLVYAPKSAMTISGGGSISTNGSACLMMVVYQLTLSGGGTASTGTCSSLSTSGTTANVALYK